MAMSDPLTLTVYALAQANLTLAEPSKVPLAAPLHLTFTHPVTPSTLALTFAPQLVFEVSSGANGGADIVHAAFQPATAYTLTLTAGRGPLAILQPDRWTFTSSVQQSHMPMIWGRGSRGIR